MSRFCAPGLLVLLLSWQNAVSADDPVFSGPQIGENLPSFSAKGVFGDLAGKEFDLIKQAEGKSVALIFFHARTRPAFGLTNTIMKYAGSKDGLESGVIFLDDDFTATENWMRRIKDRFPKGVSYGISAEGVEGPGSYGLNRNVTLTVLIGKEGKVTANFALVQPSVQADGPKILKAIVAATGGGKVPTIAELGGERYVQDTSRLRSLLRPVINKQASKEDVVKAAAKVEKYVAANGRARRELARIANTVVDSDGFANYGTETAREIIARWAKEYGAKSERKKRDQSK